MKDGLTRAEGGHTGTLGCTNFSEVSGDHVCDQQDKTARRNCTTPACFPYSRDRGHEARLEAQSGTFKEMRDTSNPCAQEQELSDLPRKEASSSDAESDFYDGTDVSCTPERTDYHTAQGKEQSLCCFAWIVHNVHATLCLSQEVSIGWAWLMCPTACFRVDT